MKTLRIAALAVAVSGVFTLGAKAGTDTNNWWDVTFDDKLGLCDLENQTVGPAGAMVVLTNQFKQGDGATVSVQTWDSGIWYTQDGDETIVTNSYNPTNTYKAYGSDLCLKLDTQGNDLTWRVDPTNTMADSRTALVDADLYLVGSDSPPDAGDFDAAEDVQTAVYLKNETDEDTGETTNSVLCVYAYDSDAKANYWQELKGVKIEDNSWASVKVVVDHAKVIDPQNPYPVVQVFVNGVKMTARDGDTDHWTAANSDAAQTAGRVSSVAFRGTGAVDNFVGKYVETTFDSYNFTAQVFMDGTLVAQGTEGNVTRVVNAEAGAGKVAKFESFMYHNFAGVENPATYSLSRIEIVDLASGETTTLRYGYTRATAQIILPENHPDDIVNFATDFAEDDEGQEYEYFTGPFTVNAPTVGATKDDTIVSIYFESLPEEGQFKLTASQNVGNAPADQIFNVNDENLPAFATFTFAESISAGGTSYILSKIKPGTAPADPITLEYESPNAVVKVPLSDEITGTQYEVATATYVEGTLGDRVLGYEWDATNGEWSFTAKDKPVAIIVAGNVTNEFSSLRAAIEASAAGDTITLVADDHVSFSAESTEIAIGKSLTIDGGSNTLYGVSGYAYDGVNDHDIFIGAAAGDVTIKDLRITEFSDTAPTVQYRTYPIWTSQGYAGKLTLDGVQIDKFARTAINLGNGTFEITNCVITGYAGATGAPERYFQNAFGVFKAKGTVADTTATGLGSTAEPWGAGVVTFNSDGDGELTFLSGSYKSDYVLEVSSNATGRLVIEGGTFVATAAAADSAFQLDEGDDATFKVAISGGWFDREPEAKYIAEGLVARQIGTDPAPWTVGQSFTITFNNDDGTEFYKTNGVFTGETGYGPANDPTKGETFTFVGWTNLVAGGAAVATADLPAANGDATWTAVFKEDSVIDPIAVTIGGDADNPLVGKDPITVDATDGFTLRFAAKQTGVTYILQSATTVNGAFADVTVNGTPVSVTPLAVDEVVELTDPDTASTVKFFRVRVVVAE